MPVKSDPPRAPRPTERVMVFIDGSNLYHVLGQVCGRHDLRFGKFIEKLVLGRDLVRAYYYNVRQDRAHNPSAAQEQERFLVSLDEVPYLETRLGIYKQRGVEMVEKGVDVMIATDLVSGAFKNLYDTAVLVSGDGDFFPAIEAVKDQGKHVEVVAFENNLSPEAERAADMVTMLKPSFFTGMWTSSRARAASGRRAGGERGTRREREVPSLAPVEEEEVVARVEEPAVVEPPRPVKPEEERPAEGRAPQRPERRRFGRRRRGGGGGPRAGGGAGGAPSKSQPEAAVTTAAAAPTEETPPPQRREPLRPPRLRPQAEPRADGAEASSPAGPVGEGRLEPAEPASVDGPRSNWFRRRISFGQDRPHAGTAPAG
ncbi:MAG: NYN domain-containing protein [Chloroflexi bacterium]|nr:NYN domain-containing protein [Chloroflexota bacterium]